jgi:anti-sigma B factor antagonist
MAEPEFAHPVELELSKVFDAHGIAWEYEPHTFVLEQDGDGTVRKALTPDFYLPELDLYVECTVMRQRLTSRKRRKVRMAREQRGLSVEILFRRDVVRLANRWGFDALAEAASSGASDRVSTGTRAGKEIAGMLERSLETRDEVFGVDELRAADGAEVLVVRGEADLHAAPELRESLRRAIDRGAHDVVVDLTDTSFVDSTALGVLLGATKSLRGKGGRLAVVVSRPDVRRIFEITLLDQVFSLHETRDDALAALRSGTAV